MAVEVKCENCIYFVEGIGEQNCCKIKNAIISTPRIFIPKEHIIRDDERRKVIEELWLTHADPNKKLYFEKDGYKFKLSLVPIIEEKENNDVVNR